MMMSKDDYDHTRCNEIVNEIFEKYKASKKNEEQHEQKRFSNRR